MSHQPFEQWILDDSQPLSTEENSLLNNHIGQCSDCSQLQEQWNHVEEMLIQAPVKHAPEGFTARWQQTFLAKKATQQKLNGKRFIHFLIFGSFTSLLMYLSLSILSGSPARFIMSFLRSSSVLALRISKLNMLYHSIQSYLPPAIPIILLILLSCSLILMLSIWGITFWKYSIKGVILNEDYQ
ncbi:MAG: hypothetical protein JEZ00_02115 [Anaerolineaceae bacterium]|nr:hypothetical protein [Anaerolineaceae bacterium]